METRPHDRVAAPALDEVDEHVLRTVVPTGTTAASPEEEADAAVLALEAHMDQHRSGRRPKVFRRHSA